MLRHLLVAHPRIPKASNTPRKEESAPLKIRLAPYGRKNPVLESALAGWTENTGTRIAAGNMNGPNAEIADIIRGAAPRMLRRLGDVKSKAELYQGVAAATASVWACFRIHRFPC